ncbi:MAG: PrgI family protein [Candidatus Uhrbacteria bacterium]
MAGQYVVPQFIDVEDRIVGPLSVRQFVILVVGTLLEVTFYKIFRLIPFVAVGIPTFLITITFAFIKMNGMPFHFFLLNLIQSLRKPKLRVWDKTMTTFEVKQGMVSPPALPPPPAVRKTLLTGSHLQELTLLVNTGGAFKPEEE